ncbi:hypothetical protein NA56DRAFT_58354 [Hyaloscypha hepaticicola]|uniref:Uncharacterized protein n=1 Tax=Hyaloscypha hepaticicola TaxID=2082293 RepID=A0A2J6PD85_9HELO|nr:hypothetical protein NA56DRAFT_58354 [Hyaloscypha hepaticicola]
MSSLLPLLKDLVPIMKGGSPVHVTKCTDLDSGTGQTDGMIRKGAIINQSDKICASAKPRSKLTSTPHLPRAQALSADWA